MPGCASTPTAPATLGGAAFRRPPCGTHVPAPNLGATASGKTAMRIGILKTGQPPGEIRAEHGDYDDMFQRLLAGRGFDFTSYHVEAMDLPASVHDADGWLITGSRHGVYEDHPFIAPLEDFIRRAMAEHVPLVGICFGHQIIAQALGGQVGKHPAG